MNILQIENLKELRPYLQKDHLFKRFIASYHHYELDLSDDHYGLCRFVLNLHWDKKITREELDVLELFISNATPTRLTRFIKGINKPEEAPGFWFHRLDKESRVKHLLKIQKMLDL
jgi:hypothetical protein